VDESYYTVADLDRLERLVQRHIFDEGYNSRMAGLLLEGLPTVPAQEVVLPAAAALTRSLQ
jgi:hypothetical protein